VDAVRTDECHPLERGVDRLAGASGRAWARRGSESDEPDKDISIYINSPAAWSTPG
jgi:hypothetical protein